MQITAYVNGVDHTREVEPRLLLLHLLRDDLGLTDTHWGCDTSNCGTCVVWFDGKPAKSCTVLAAMADGHHVRTVEGRPQLPSRHGSARHPIRHPGPQNHTPVRYRDD